MRHIERVAKPEILEKKEEEWISKFLASEKSRPDSSKYGNPKIRERLHTMSHGKCFYCETLLEAGTAKEIDHFIEVAEDKSLAYRWDNLYLACSNCNAKVPNRSIPASSVLDPCHDTDEEIAKHLTFEDETIQTVANSKKGLDTIRKYKLGSELLDRMRGKKLHKFNNTLIEFLLLQQGSPFSDKQKQILHDFANADRPYSLMFKTLIAKYEDVLGEIE